MKSRIGTLAIIAAALAIVASSVAPAPAAAKRQPCWKALINDWYDGRIDFEYPAKCYSEAIKHAPEDLQGYSDLASDLTRALQSASKGQNGAGALVKPGSPGHNGKGANDGNTQNGDTDRTQSDRSFVVPPNSGGSNGPGGPAQRAIAEVGDSGPDSIPLPLLALGALALLLLAAGAAGLVARRVQARRTAPAGPIDGAP